MKAIDYEENIFNCMWLP